MNFHCHEFISRSSSRWRHWLTALHVAALCGGCGGGNPDLVRVTGTVTLDGAPLAEVAVTFTPTGDTLGNGAIGGCDAEGHFTLTDIRGGEGALPGEYKVSFYPTPSGASAGDPGDVVAGGGVGLPGDVVNPNSTSVRATVPPGGADVQIALTTGGEPHLVEVTAATADL
ncbi:MAG: hypothetical protein R3C10_18705 [Pirellulales bacterium]